MDNQINNNKFKKDEEKIKEKIKSIEKGINDDLSLIPEYQLLNVYLKISKILEKEEKKFTILKNKFLFKDKTLTGYINLKNFHDILNNNLTLEKDELKILMCDPVLRNKINPNLYQYKPFLDKISNFDENEIIKMRQEYNLDQNKYIIDLRNTIIIKKINLKNLWENIYKDNTKCTKNNFYLLFNEIKSKYTYHYLEIEYIFDLICKKGEESINYDEFIKIMNKRPGEDLRVLYFKKIKKEKEKEEKKEEEKILINYYPNLLDNNNNNNMNENNNDKTNYIIVKGEDNLNGENDSKNNSNEKFILGNINPNNDNNDINNINSIHQQNKAVNSIEEKLEIPKSLIFNEQGPKETSNQDINNNKNSQTVPPNVIKFKKYYKTICDVNNNLIENATIVKDKTYFDEINTKSQHDINDLINKRINNSNEKVNYILSQHEEYIILKLYSLLNHQISLSDKDILMTFQNKDTQNKKILSFNDFISILQKDLNLNFNQQDLKILLNSLENADVSNGQYSYLEFIGNLNNNKNKNNDRIKQIERLALINYNLYLVDFKKYIKNNNINVNNIFNAVSNDKNKLNLKEFISFCDCAKYKLSNISEYKYIFDVISKDPSKNKVSKNDLNNYIDSEFIPENKFIEDGKCHKNLGKNNNRNWYKYIPKYNINDNSLNFTFIERFEKLFSVINIQKNKFGISNLADFFSLICNVDINGNIYKDELLKGFLIIEIINQPLINDLLFYLEDINNNKKFQLSNFIGIFEMLYPPHKIQSQPPHNFKTYPRNPNIIFKNNYGYFLPIDLKEIKELCSNIYEVIYFIKRQTISTYFKKFDFFQRGYFAFDQLKLILLDDLEIKKNELIDLFISYVLGNQKVNDLYIIKIERLIEEITKNVGIKVDDEENLFKTTFHYSDEISNKLLNSTIMNIRINKKLGASYSYSPNAGIY